MTNPLHASAVAFGGNAALITGASGTGKSTLAWTLIGLGGLLVSDDRVVLAEKGGLLHLAPPEAIQGKIEARGMGILTVQFAPAIARVVIDLDHPETARLPKRRVTLIRNVSLPLLHKLESAAFGPMIKAYLQSEMWNDTNYP